MQRNRFFFKNNSVQVINIKKKIAPLQRILTTALNKNFRSLSINVSNDTYNKYVPTSLRPLYTIYIRTNLLVNSLTC